MTQGEKNTVEHCQDYWFIYHWKLTQLICTKSRERFVYDSGVTIRVINGPDSHHATKLRAAFMLTKLKMKHSCTEQILCQSTVHH